LKEPANQELLRQLEMGEAMPDRKQRNKSQTFLVIVSVAALIAQSCFVPGFAAQKNGTLPLSSQVPTEDIGWPRQVQDANANLIYYQPQIDEWKDYKELYTKFAFSLTPKGGKEALGVADVQCETLVDKDSRLAYFHNVQFTSVRFPSLDAQAEASLEKLFQDLIPRSPDPISVERLMADLDHNKIQAPAVQLNNDPPQIFYSASQAVLLIVQGDPVLAPIAKTDLQFIVNTNWDLFFEKSKKAYYLFAANGWYTAKEGPWAQTLTLPKDMGKLPAGENFDDVKKMVPPPPPGGAVPQIFFSSTPAELIVLKGSPVYSKISGTDLYLYYGDEFKIECPIGSGKMLTLFEVAEELSRRLYSTFLKDPANGNRRPVYGGDEKFQSDPHWRDLILFYEYFHGDNGAGMGASHQTGWTGLVARLIGLSVGVDPKQLLNFEHKPVLRESNSPQAGVAASAD
jgi:hypothetical protein